MFLINTYLDKSKIQGVGVFSNENVRKGQKIKEAGGGTRTMKASSDHRKFIFLSCVFVCLCFCFGY